MKRTQHPQRLTISRQGGYVLVLVAMLLFGLFAMAALVIDLGFARVAQRQMQTASDAAALEGLRGEGVRDYGTRQDAAEQLVTWTFDDDLNATNGSVGNVGAGPNVTFSGGVGDSGLHAGRLITVDPDNASHQPVLQRRANQLAGQEFSIAIQRGGNVDREFDLLAEGPAVPYLFARGSLLDRERVGDGIATGGVARAIADRALAVGLPIIVGGIEIYPGAIAIGYEIGDWNSSRSSPRQIDSPKTLVGQSVINQAPASLLDGYCCIFSSVGGVDRVVGFGVIDGAVALPVSVAVSNASARQGSTWNQIDVSVRDAVLTQNATIIGGLLVARLAPGA